MGESFFSEKFKNPVLGVGSYIHFNSLKNKVQFQLSQALGKEAADGIISNYLNRLGKRYFLVYNLLNVFQKYTHIFYSNEVFSKLLSQKKSIIDTLFKTPNPARTEINSLWNLEYYISHLKNNKLLNFDVNKDTIEKIQVDCKKVIRSYMLDNKYISKTLDPSVFNVIWESLHAISDIDGNQKTIADLSKDLIGDKEYISKMFRNGGSLLPEHLKNLISLLSRKGVDSNHMAVQWTKECLTKGSSISHNLISLEIYFKDLLTTTGLLKDVKTAKKSCLTPAQAIKYRKALWLLTGHRSWYSGKILDSFDDVLVHHIRHDSTGKTLYDDKHNAIRFFDSLINLVPLSISEGENQLVEGKKRLEWEAKFIDTWEKLKKGELDDLFDWWDLEDRIDLQKYWKENKRIIHYIFGV